MYVWINSWWFLVQKYDTVFELLFIVITSTYRSAIKVYACSVFICIFVHKVNLSIVHYALDTLYLRKNLLSTTVHKKVIVKYLVYEYLYIIQINDSCYLFGNHHTALLQCTFSIKEKFQMYNYSKYDSFHLRIQENFLNNLDPMSNIKIYQPRKVVMAQEVTVKMKQLRLFLSY